MAFNLVSLLSSRKNEDTTQLRLPLESAVQAHAPLELFEVRACGLRMRSGVFFNNICQDRLVFELYQHSCPRGLRKGQHAVCSFALPCGSEADDLWEYRKFETRISQVTQNYGRSSVQLALPRTFSQQHRRNGQRLPLGSDDTCSLQAWSCEQGLPAHFATLLDRPPLLQNGIGGNVWLRDVSKGGMGLLLQDHGSSVAPQLLPGVDLLLRLVLPHGYRAEPLHGLFRGRLVRCMHRPEGRKAGVQLTHMAASLQQDGSLDWQLLDAAGAPPLAELVRQRCERLKAGPLR